MSKPPSAPSRRKNKLPVVANSPPDNIPAVPLPPDPKELFYSLSAAHQETIIRLILDDPELLNRLYDLMLKDALTEATLQNITEDIKFFHFFPLVYLPPEKKIYIRKVVYAE